MMFTMDPRRAGRRRLAFDGEMHFTGDHHEDGGRVGMHAGIELGARRRGIVGRVLFGIEDDLLLPVVLTGMHLLKIG